MVMDCWELLIRNGMKCFISILALNDRYCIHIYYINIHIIKSKDIDTNDILSRKCDIILIWCRWCCSSIDAVKRWLYAFWRCNQCENGSIDEFGSGWIYGEILMAWKCICYWWITKRYHLLFNNGNYEHRLNIELHRYQVHSINTG